MRILRKILFYLGSFVSLLVNGALAFLNIRALIATDYALAQSPIAASLSYAFRGAFFVFAFLTVINVIVFEVQKDRKFSWALIIVELAVIFGASFSAIYYDWFVSLAILVPLLFCFLFRRFGER